MKPVLETQFGRIRLDYVALFGLVSMTCGALLLAIAPPPEATSVTVPLVPPRASALIEATAATNDFQAVGDQAKMLNASLPFDGAPVSSARPFTSNGSDVDYRRALLCLTQAVYYEAGFEPAEGRRAVAQVVLNRLRHPAFPKSVCGVVYQGSGSATCQFTFVCDGALYRAPALGAWREAETIARAALAGYVEPSVGESTFYHADYVAPRWAPLLAKVAQIGQHIFYRWPGSWGQPSAFIGRYIGEPRDPMSLRPPPPAVAPATTGDMVTAQVADAGPAIARAPEDVGGLLDTTKGWTLNIPAPQDTESAAARLLAAQQAKAAATSPAPVAQASAGSLVASR
jgi:spore germination cell wall hydrolase CwlJ-like protein